MREMVSGNTEGGAAVVFNPLTSKLAEDAGFPALYLGGGTFGYIQCYTEANLTLTEMVRLGVDIPTVSRLPLILDGASGWGDPIHLRRATNMVETAAFARIDLDTPLIPNHPH